MMKKQTANTKAKKVIFDFKKIKTIDDVYKLADEEARQDYDKAMAGYTTPYRTAHNMALLMSNAAWITDGKTIDWNDRDQDRYWPVFLMAPVFRFGHSIYDCGDSIAGAGSRLSFPTIEWSKFFAEKFPDVFKELQF